MKAKKCIALLLAASLTASLFSACGSANNDSSSSESESAGSSAASGSTGTAEDGGDPAFQKFDEVVEVGRREDLHLGDRLLHGRVGAWIVRKDTDSVPRRSFTQATSASTVRSPS